MLMGWKQCQLGDVLTLQRGFDITKKEQKQGSVPVISSSGINSFHNTAKVNGPGVIIGRKGSLGTVFYIEEDYWPHDTTLWVKDFHGNFPKFAYYFLSTLNLAHFDAGASNPTLNRNHVHLLPVYWPPLPIQSKIASILSAYDDLIENNTHRIAILEEMARMLYQEWFVKFRFPGHEQVKMVESEMGMIPEGWEVKPIGQLLEYHIGGGWGNDREDEAHQYLGYVIRGTDIPKARYLSVDSCPLRYHKKSNISPRRLQPEDIVFEVSGGSKGQPVGRSLFVSSQLLKQFEADVICASFCKLLRIDRSLISPRLVYLHLLGIYSNGQINQYQVQSTGITNFKFEHFLHNEKVIIPAPRLQEHFKNLTAPIFDSVQNLGIRNANLRRTRDFLLPKLVSGEIDVSSWVEGEVGEQEMEEAIAVAATGPARVRMQEPVEAIDASSMERPSLWK